MKYFDTMLQQALRAQTFAYAPYSKFQVGASILSNHDTIYSGCNIENASFGLTQCAESTAIGNMISQGGKEILAVLIVGPYPKICSPCGKCRQVIHEFAKSETIIYLCNKTGLIKQVTIGELLPLAYELSLE